MAEIIGTKQIPLDKLVPHPQNYRRGDVVRIKASLKRLGQYRTIVVREDTMEILAGNHTYKAMRELGWAKASVGLVKVESDDEARRILAADNGTADHATNDPESLADLLGSFDGDLEGTGYDQADLDKLLDDLTPPEPPDTAPQLGEVHYQIIVQCDGELHQAELLERFAAEGLQTQAIAQ